MADGKKNTGQEQAQQPRPAFHAGWISLETFLLSCNTTFFSSYAPYLLLHLIFGLPSSSAQALFIKNPPDAAGSKRQGEVGKRKRFRKA